MLEITYSKRLILTLLVLLCTSVCGFGQETRRKIEDAAKRLPYLIWDGSLSCDSRWFDDLYPVPAKAREMHRQILLDLVTADHPTKDLLPLLKHKDPKVRTLSIMALVNKEDPKLLPAIHALAKDTAPTFGRPPADFNSAPKAIDAPEMVKIPVLEKQTVGDVAKVAVLMYRNAARVDRETTFEAYWAPRKDRDYCATWFLVRLQNANQALDLTRNRVPRLKALRKDIDRLPADDRAWTLLWLHGKRGSEDGHLITDKELVAICQKLGQDKLLKMLAREKISADPDLQPATGNHGYMIGFVLEHVKELMTKDAAAPLLKLADASAKEGDTPYHLYMAAAELQPNKAGEITKIAAANLKDAFKTHPRRADITHPRRADISERVHWAQALWTVAGTAESKFLLEWFYTEKADTYTPHVQFLSHVAMIRPKENRAFLAQLARDPRFDQLDWASIDRFIRIVNAWTKKPIVPESDLADLRGPGGMVLTQWHNRKEIVDDLQRRYPNEMAHLNKTLGQWRQKVRDSVKEWNP